MAQRRLNSSHVANGHANGSANGHVDTSASDKKTDYSRWRLLNEDGRHTWHYLTDDEDMSEWPQTAYDQYFLGRDTV